MLAMGTNIDEFDVPVCNTFQAKVLNDQLCYEVDLKKFSDENSILKELKLGLSFLLDYNEDRQVTLNQENNSLELGLASSFDESEENSHAIVYLDTIGKEIFHLYMFENEKKYCEAQARIGKGWPSRRKALKLKALPRAYTKFGCHPPPATTHQTFNFTQLMARWRAGEVGGGKGRCVVSLWVTLGSL